jgi:hypothetical protein
VELPNPRHKKLQMPQVAMCLPANEEGRHVANREHEDLGPIGHSRGRARARTASLS